MSQSYTLYIPPHIPIESIIKVLGRYYYDEDLEKSTFKDNGIDTEKPSNPSNRWYFNYKIKSEQLEYSYGSYVFETSILGNKTQDFYSQYFLHTDPHIRDEKYMGYKCISGTSNALNLAGAQKLLVTVGGKLIYIDSHEEIYEVCEEPLLGREFFQFIEHETYFEFINFLDKMPRITPEDIVKMQEFACYELSDDTQKEFAKRYEKVLIKKDKDRLEDIIKTAIPTKALKI